MEADPMEINVHAFSASLQLDDTTAGCFLSLAGAGRRQPIMKTQWCGFLREHMDDAMGRVENSGSAA
jgi:hypothetical protein